jgi:hypothetical protein
MRSIDMQRTCIAVLSFWLAVGLFLSAGGSPAAAQAPQPPTIELVGQIGGMADAVAMQGDYAYVAAGVDGLRIIGVADPAHPVETGRIATPPQANDVAVAGGYAYVAARYAGLRIIDIADVAHPVEVGFYRTPAGQAQAVAVAGTIAYVADQGDGLRIVDVSDPAHPAELGTDPILRDASDVAVAGSLAYVTDLRGGLRVIDVADPTRPTELGHTFPPGFAGAVAVQGQIAYVASTQGLSLVDVADPAHPAQISFLDTPGTAALDVAVAGNLAYVADVQALRVVDVSDPAQPAEVGSFTPAAGSVVGVSVAGGLVYVAAESGGLVILRVGAPAPSGLVNGGFEDGFYLLMGQSIANGWAPYVLAGQPSFAGERSTLHSGSWSYKISGYAPFTAGLAQVVAVQPGRTYRVTAFYQLYPPGDGQAFLGVQDGSSAPHWVGAGWPGEWRPLSQTITPATDRLLISVQGANGALPNTNVYFDDVTLVVLGAP